MKQERILILVPHPDDEVVAAAASIRRAQKAGAHVMALYLTHGCVAKEVMWPWQRSRYDHHRARRHKEALRVTEALSLSSLAWSSRPARHVWRELAAIYTEIDQAIETNVIDQLWVPAFEGGNADHDATNALASLFRDRCPVFEFAEYNYYEGRVRSHEFPKPNGTEVTVLLTPEEQGTKRDLLAFYISEAGNLNYVKAEKECYRPLPDYDYSKPPHEGVLWYERFQWVPFQHPRVDFTKGKDVAQALSQFLEKFHKSPRAKAG